MPYFSADERINIAYKMVFGIQGTTNTSDSLGRQWYEEPYPWNPLLISNDVWINTIPNAGVGQADTAVSNNPTVLEKIEIKLTKKTGFNGRVWAAHTTYNDENSAILDNFLLPQKFGTGYTARFYQDDGSGNPGTEILTTEGAWVYSYKAGLLLLADGYLASDVGWTEPIHIVAYRYIGQTVANIAGTSIDLDAAYDNGQEIDIDKGPVTLDATPGVNAYSPLNLTNLANAPTSSLSAGDIAVIDGELYAYDSARSKWLSVNRSNVTFGLRYADSRYLMHSDSFAARFNGFLLNKDSCIISVYARADGGNINKTFHLRRNSSLTDLASYSLAGGGIYLNNSLNINLNGGEYLQVFADGNGAAARNFTVQLEIAHRK